MLITVCDFVKERSRISSKKILESDIDRPQGPTMVQSGILCDHTDLSLALETDLLRVSGWLFN